MSATTYQVRPAGSRFESLMMITATLVVGGSLALYVEERGQNDCKNGVEFIFRH